MIITDDTATIVLGTEYMPIHTDGPYIDVDEMPVRWDNNKDVLARITVPMHSGSNYTPQLDWLVLPVRA